MSVPQKYMFDNSFDEDAETVDPLEELKASFQEKIAAAKAQAFEEGKHEGQKEAQQTIENQTKLALEKIASQEQELQKSYDQALQQLEAKAIEFGITAGSKLAGELINQEPMPLIERFFKDAFKTIFDVPEITAKIHPSIANETIKQHQKWMQATGYKGNITFLADESLNPTDALITWKDGGIQRSVDELFGAISAAMTNYFAARNQQSQTLQAKTTTDDQVTPQIAQLQPVETNNQSECPS